MFLFAGVSSAFMILGYFVFEADEPSTEEDKRVDWIGAAMVTTGLVLIVFVLSDAPTAHKGWKNPREFSSSFFKFHHDLMATALHRRHHPVYRWHLARPSFHRVAVLLGAQAREPGSPAYPMDCATAYEAVDVDTCARSLRCHASGRVLLRCGVRVLAIMVAAVLSDVPGLEPHSNDAAHAATVLRGPRRKHRHRFHDRACQCHVPRGHGHAYGRLCGRPVRRDRSEGIILGVRLPGGIFRRARDGPHVHGWHAVRRQGRAPERAERRGCVGPGDDANRLGDWY